VDQTNWYILVQNHKTIMLEQINIIQKYYEYG